MDELIWEDIEDTASQDENIEASQDGIVWEDVVSDQVAETTHLKDAGVEIAEESDVPTFTSEKKATLYDTLTASHQPKTYEEINTMGMDFPERSFTDVMTGRSGIPQEL